jgi:phosphoserine phosphatase
MEFNVKFKDYPSDVWQKINSTLELVLKSDPNPIAAFDADGTLWDTDLGEAFFDYLIENKKVPLPVDPWTHYENLKAQHPPTAYLWLAQICQNQKIETIRKWTEEAVKGLDPVPVFGPQKKLIDYFLMKNVQVFIITASVKWSVEPGAALFTLPKESVIGVETEVVNDVVTDKQKGVITYRQGKVDALLDRTFGKKPFFASGNSEGDQELLMSATHLSLAVSASHRDDQLFKSEAKLMALAKSRNWLSHYFTAGE